MQSESWIHFGTQVQAISPEVSQTVPSGHTPQHEFGFRVPSGQATACRRRNCPPAHLSRPTSIPSMTIGFGSRHSPVPGKNPEVLDELAEVEELVEEELVDEPLLLATVVLPELDEELVPAPPAPPLPSIVTSVVQPDCIPNPRDTNKALANTSRDERRGAVNVRFMIDPPRAQIEHRSCHCEKLVSSEKTSRHSAPHCAEVVIHSH